MPRWNKADKAVFFDELYALIECSDNEEDENGIHKKQSVPETQRMLPSYSSSTKSNHSSEIAAINRQSSRVRRTVSQPALSSATAVSKVNATTTNSALLTEALIPQNILTQIEHIQRSPRRKTSAIISSNIAPSHIMKGSVLGKRKRKEQPIKLVSEAQQVFKGLKFFYLPNDDIAPIRRARIRKAREHGVFWTTSWEEEGITHMIVDKELSYQDVVKFLKIDSIPNSIVMVQDNYPLDCIQFKAILDPTQRQYRVIGHDQPCQDKISQNPISQTSDISLQLKSVQSKPGQRDSVSPQATSPRSESLTPITVSVTGDDEMSDDSSPGAWLAPTPNLQAAIVIEENDNLLEESSLGMQIRSSAPVDGGDALDEMIKEAQKLKDLPLDSDDDDRPSSPGSVLDFDAINVGNVSPSPENRQPSTKHLNKRVKMQENFSCMKSGTGKPDDLNPNARTIAVLQEMADYYSRINDTWRPLAYRKCISTLKRHNTKVYTAEQAIKLPFVGQRLALKIEEIVTTDRLRQLDNAKAESGEHILQRFIGIYGVGFHQANKWLCSGYKTFEDLKVNAKLTEHQLVGIEHYDDFHTRIPRDEVTALATTIKSHAAIIDAKVEIIIGGSYRRGASSSGDIDCLITKPHTSHSHELFDFLNMLVARLTSAGFLVAALATPRSTSGTTWHGCCILPGPARPLWRRIDFLLVPATERGAALLYFTGNDIFNRSMRLLASRQGMRLNQRGLYSHGLRSPGGAKPNERARVEGADEKRIFAALGVPWRPPEQRIC